MDAHRLEYLAARASYYRVIEVDDDVAGFVLAMSDGCGYENGNFGWFSERFGRFLYVDRVIVDNRYAGRGLGRALYGDVFSAAMGAGQECIVCEYSWVPKNVASERFHAAMGFIEVGQRTVGDGTKVLSMQRRDLS